MSIEREAVRHSEPWREAFRAYMTTMLENSDKITNVSGSLAAALADIEFGIEPKDKAP